MLVNVDFELKSHDLELGQSVTGNFIWQSAKESRKSVPIEISVGWYTRGKGIRDQQIVCNQIFNEVKSEAITPFTIMVPTNAPPTYNGRLIQIVWEVKMTVYIHQFWGKFGNQKEEYFAALNVFPSHRRR